jgi:nitrogen regulatory protein PII
MYMMPRKSMFLMCGLVSSTIIIIFISSFSLIPMKTAFGDGLFMEELSASIGNRKADLLIKMTPPVVTTEMLQNQVQKPVIQFKLFDANTDDAIKHVTYFITIEKNDKKVLSDWFHDHNGDLRVEIRPKNTSVVTVYGEPDPILLAYTGTENSPVIAEGPIFLEGGLYHFIVRIVTVDFDRTIIPDAQQPVYDGWLSIGNSEEQQITIDGKQIPIQILSYYDKLNSFEFDESKRQMEFTMPFDWNTTRLEENQILVHEEVTVPKPSEFAAERSYVGTVNDMDVTKNIVLDDTDPQKDVIHFMLPKPEVIKIAEQVNNKSGQASSSSSSSSADELMKFTLQPGGIGEAAAASTNTNNTSSNQTTQQASSSSPSSNATSTTTVSPPMEKLTDGGTYKINMSYSPANIQPTNTTTFNIEFLDPKTNQKKDNVQYDFMIMPAEDPESMLTHRAAKIAQNGSAQQSFTFKDENVGSVIARVSNINNTGEFADFPITVTKNNNTTTSTNTNNTSSNQTTQQASSSSPSSNATSTTTVSPPMEKLTDGGTYKINMSYSPANIQPTNTTTFNIEFLDPKTNQKKDNVQYDFMIMPAEDPESMLTHRAAKIAQNGSAQQSFTFKDENVGSVIARVSNINNTGEFADFPITVVPEFPFTTVIYMATAFGLIISLAIFTKRKSLYQ